MKEWTIGRGIAVGLIAIAIMGCFIASLNFVERNFLDGCDYDCPREIAPPCIEVENKEIVNNSNGKETKDTNS